VATFLAVLELTKSGRIFLNDDNTEITFNRETKRRHSKSKTDEAVHSDGETAVESDLTENSAEIEVQDTAEKFDTEENIEQETAIELDFGRQEDTVSAEEISHESEITVASHREKYAMESRISAHSMLLVIDDISENEDSQTADETVDFVQDLTADEAPADNASAQEESESLRTDAEYSVKLNRFSRRYRWRFPECEANCWKYGRERM
jgi:segregation and condensation protein A